MEIFSGSCQNPFRYTFRILSDTSQYLQYLKYFKTESALLQSVLSDTFSSFRAQKKPETPNLHFDS